MKKIIQTVIVAAGLAGGLATSLQAQNTYNKNIYFTGSITNWVVPIAGDYSIRAYGAQGGGYNLLVGGYGAVIGGTFELQSGYALNLLVGGQGGYISGQAYGGAGGGGTFVVGPSNTPLVIAGGGGGPGIDNSDSDDSMNASITTSGNNAWYYGHNKQGSGGTDGNGGTIGSDSSKEGGAGGGGFYTDGGTHLANLGNPTGTVVMAAGGSSFLNGGAGGNASGSFTWGGFGGGGQSGNGGGGGGGYSGGGGGYAHMNIAGKDFGGSGGGGGSYLDSSASNVVMYTNNPSNANYTTNGQVWISLVTSDLLVGSSFDSSAQNLAITSGIQAEANVLVGVSAGYNNNSLTVANAGTMLTSSSNLVVGLNSVGNSLVVSNGAIVDANLGGVLGYNAGSSNNTVLVTGNNSFAYLGSGPSGLVGNLTVGSNGASNSLVISNGGAAFSTAVMLGENAGASNNSVLVTGAGSQFNNMGNVSVGNSSTGNSLVISDGGYVQSSGGQVGSNAGSGDNRVLVTGSGSFWNIMSSSDGMRVGVSGEGTLTVANGGEMSINSFGNAGGLTLAESAGSSGTLNIGRFGTNDAAGTISTARIGFGAGTGTINFNQTNSTTLSAAISGNGTVNQLGSGTTTLTGDNTYTGTTTVAGGTLIVATGTSISGSTTTVGVGAQLTVNGAAGVVSVNGTLSGSGTVGTVTLNSGGTLAVVNSPGLLTAASASWNGGSTFQFEILNATGMAGTAWDLFSVTGALDMTTISASNKMNLTILSADLQNFQTSAEYSWVFAQAASLTGAESWTSGLDVTDRFVISSTGFNGGTQPDMGFKVVTGTQGGLATLSILSVPEPSSVSLLLAGIGGLMVLRRRRKSWFK